MACKLGFLLSRPSHESWHSVVNFGFETSIQSPIITGLRGWVWDPGSWSERGPFGLSVIIKAAIRVLWLGFEVQG